jgi:TolB-like protein/Tfp pilus assembly protein PilF
MQVLVYLADHAGEVVTRDEILQAVWEGTFVSDEVLTIAISKLRKAFGDDGNESAFIQTVPKKGYRLNASVSPVEELQEPPAPVPVVHGSRWGVLALVGALATLLVVAVGLNLGGLRDRLTGRTPGAPIESIAVLPLQNLSGDPEQEYFADGMTAALITDLSKIGALKVISLTSAIRYKGSDKSLPEIARELDVDAIVEGSALRVGDRARITAQLIHAETDQHLWSESYERDFRDVLALQSEVARGIADKIQVELTTHEQNRLAKAGPVAPAAIEAYMKGLLYFQDAINQPDVERRKESHYRSFEYLEKAIAMQPDYAPAYAALARSYHWFAGAGGKEFLAKAKDAAMTALQIDETLGEAHGTFAWTTLRLDWDWPGAERHYRRAIELNPNLANSGYHGYSFFLSAAGRHDEAIAAIKRAEELDPLTHGIKMSVGMMYLNARRYDDAIEQYRSSIALHRAWPMWHEQLGSAYALRGQHEEAITEFQRAVSLSGGAPRYKAGLAWAYARSGRRNEAQKMLEELKEPSKQRGTAYRVALVYAALGDEASEAREGGHLFLNVDPEFDSLHSDPRFQDLLRRMNFPE